MEVLVLISGLIAMFIVISRGNPLCHVSFSFSQAGRQGREKFGSKKARKKRLNEFASTSNKVRIFFSIICNQIKNNCKDNLW